MKTSPLVLAALMESPIGAQEIVDLKIQQQIKDIEDMFPQETKDYLENLEIPDHISKLKELSKRHEKLEDDSGLNMC